MRGWSPSLRLLPVLVLPASLPRRPVRSAAVRILHGANRATSLIGLKVVRANLLSEEWFKKLAYFARLLERTKDVEGDVVECGVAAGKNLAIIASLVRSSGQDRCLWGFDSWDSPSPRTADEWRAAPKVAFSGATIREVRLRLRQMGFDDLNGIKLVKGELAKTLPEAPERIAFVHIELFSHELYRICLENLWPRLEPGGIVSLGGYKPEITTALAEFLANIPQEAARLESDPSWHHRRFIVKS
jgi:hypothetical protein